MGRLVMAYWDCPSCGSKEIRGDQASCPNCGRARGQVKFYMRDYTEGEVREADQRSDVEYVEEEKAEAIGRNPDWVCSFCQSLNSDKAKFCTSCGASRESSEANYFQMHEALQAREEARKEPKQQAPVRQTKKRSLLPILLIIAAVAALVMFLNSSKTRGDFQVESISWNRVIDIEENRMFQESGWSLPSGAEVTGQQRELHHYDSVLDHYENREVQRSRQVVDHYEQYYTYTDMGNGTYEEVSHDRPVYRTEYYTETVREPVYRQVPNYQTKYYYNIWRWTSSRQAVAGGTDHEPAWPETNLAENEREGQRAEVYRIVVKDTKSGKNTTYRMKEAEWMQVNPGDGLYITAKRTGADAYISNEKGEKLMDLYADR
jgi:hypothetical protein